MIGKKYRIFYNLNDQPINLEHGSRIMKALEMFPADDIQTWHNDKVS